MFTGTIGSICKRRPEGGAHRVRHAGARPTRKTRPFCPVEAVNSSDPGAITRLSLVPLGNRKALAM
jgi:hypothetical protein